MKQCQTCRFWARDQFGRALGGPHCDGSASDCRRHAPRVFERLTGYVDGLAIMEPRACWPVTGKQDGCGDHEPMEWAVHA